MLRGQNWKHEAGQRLRGCHGLLWRHDLSDHGVIALNGDGLAPCGYAVQYLAGISGEFCSADGLHCLVPNEYAWVRILHELSISAGLAREYGLIRVQRLRFTGQLHAEGGVKVLVKPGGTPKPVRHQIA